MLFSWPCLCFYKGLIEAFDGEVYEGRWATIMHAIGEILQIERAIRTGWDLGAFLTGGTAHEEEEEGRCNLDVTDFAIKSELFWSYAKMLDHLGEVILKLIKYGEGCHCHTIVSLFLKGPSRHTDPQERQSRPTPCAMRGRRAPEMEAGDFMAFVRQILEVVNGTIVIALWFIALNPEDRSLLMDDWTALRLHLRFTLNIKLSFWRQLRWILFGLAHHLSDRAVECGRRALALAAMYGRAGQHELALQFCFCGGLLYDQMVLFCRGITSISTLPDFETAVSWFKFVMVVERWIESQHAMLKKDLAHTTHVTCAHIAYMNIQSGLRDYLESSPTAVLELARCCSQTRNSKQALDVAGLSNHPSVCLILQGFNMKQQHVLYRKFPAECNEILYHFDSGTIFKPLPAVEHDQDGPAPPPPPGPGPPPAPGHPGGPQDPSTPSSSSGGGGGPPPPTPPPPPAPGGAAGPGHPAASGPPGPTSSDAGPGAEMIVMGIRYLFFKKKVQ